MSPMSSSSKSVTLPVKPDTLPHQSAVRDFYETDVIQICVASIICMNFVISACEAQLRPKRNGMDEAVVVFYFFELIFNIIFTIELAINFYANFFLDFWKSGWNLFDFLVVSVAWISMFADNVPGMGILRLFRAFRVFRLFKKIQSLKIIMIGIVKSMPGVLNACVLLVVVMGIWAIMGVQFFSEDFPDEFGSFGKAMLSMMQIATFDGWVSGITRPVCLYYGKQVFTFVYFISYCFMSAIILLNVVVAILLDKFIAASSEVEPDNSKNEKQARLQETRIEQSVILLQRNFRAWLHRRAVDRSITCRQRLPLVLKIQSAFRGWRARRKLRSLVDQVPWSSDPAVKKVLFKLTNLEVKSAMWQEEVNQKLRMVLQALDAKESLQPCPLKSLPGLFPQVPQKDTADQLLTPREYVSRVAPNKETNELPSDSSFRLVS